MPKLAEVEDEYEQAMAGFMETLDAEQLAFIHMGGKLAALKFAMSGMPELGSVMAIGILNVQMAYLRKKELENDAA